MKYTKAEIVKNLKYIRSDDHISQHEAIRSGIPEVLIEAIDIVKEGTSAFSLLMEKLTVDVIDAAIAHYTDPKICKRFGIFYLFSNPNMSSSQADKLISKITVDSITTYADYNYNDLPKISQKYLVKALDKFSSLVDFNWKEFYYYKNNSLFVGLALNKLVDATDDLEFIQYRMKLIGDTLSRDIPEEGATIDKFSEYTDLVYLVSVAEKYDIDLSFLPERNLYEIK